MERNAKSSRLLSLLFAVSLLCLILTLAISLPIYIRPFYYAHIRCMNLPETSGFTAEEIREAYDQVLNYLTVPGREFGTGIMAHSDSGADHFADCKVLFDLNKYVMMISGSVLALLLLLYILGITGPYRLGRRYASFWAAVGAKVLPVVLGILAALDFNRAFVVFHSIFFPGKSNWIFDYRTDPIILVLPQNFFMHCAMLIAAGILFFGGVVLVWDRRWTKRRQKTI